MLKSEYDNTRCDPFCAFAHGDGVLGKGRRNTERPGECQARRECRGAGERFQSWRCAAKYGGGRATINDGRFHMQSLGWDTELYDMQPSA